MAVSFEGAGAVVTRDGRAAHPARNTVSTTAAAAAPDPERRPNEGTKPTVAQLLGSAPAAATERSEPAGALPTGVRTAETMTASVIEILQQILDSLTHLRHPAVEQMVGRVKIDELFRL